MSVAYADLKAQYHGIKAEVDAAIFNVLESAQFVLGKEVAAFEEEFASYCHSRYCAGVNSGTSALHLALLAAGVGPGDEVITVSMTFVATVAAIRYTGAVPVFVDVDPRTYTMDPRRIEEAITSRTRAIIPVHLYGHPADMDGITAIARQHGLAVIEDACQAHGADYRGRRAGSLGDLACFSFYPGKNLGACGEGGAVVTANPEFMRLIRMYRDWGAEKKYHHVLKGYNYRMEGLQGAILRVKLRHLEAWTEARRAHAALYHRLLAGNGVRLPEERLECRHVYHVYGVMTPQRDLLARRLQEHEIQTNIHYPIPVHLLQAHADLGYGPGDFPVTEQIAREELSLPMYAEMPDGDIEQVAEVLRDPALMLNGTAHTADTLTVK